MIKINVKTLETNINHAASWMKVLSNPHRLKIICVLYYGEKFVGELGVATGLSQSAMSQHLARLRRAGLVETRRDGQAIYYSLTQKFYSEVLYSPCEVFHEDEVVSA